jgi:NAD(P)H-flavin reductase/ferredoxin
MSHEVLFEGTDISFPCAPEETILDAAERAGYSIPYSCRKGVCSTCTGELTSGELAVRGAGTVTGPAQGVLLCQARPGSAVTVAPARVSKYDPAARKTYTAKVHSISWAADNVAVVQLRFPIGSRAVFTAGQYLRVYFDDGDSRNYSIANAPHKNDGVQLHIRSVPGGRFSGEVLHSLSKGTPLRVELPYGEFAVNTESELPAILLATGTGFAPIKSLVEDQIRKGLTRPMHLYWGGGRAADFYLDELPRQWALKYPWFSYTPMLLDPVPGWEGRTGWIQHAAVEDCPNAAGTEVYACGNNDMIIAARTLFTAAGLPRDSFYSDAFVPSGTLAQV